MEIPGIEDYLLEDNLNEMDGNTCGGIQKCENAAQKKWSIARK